MRMRLSSLVFIIIVHINVTIYLEMSFFIKFANVQYVKQMMFWSVLNTNDIIILHFVSENVIISSLASIQILHFTI